MTVEGGQVRGAGGNGKPDGGRRLRVLLVEDDADLLDLAETIFQAADMQVVTAANGRRALNTLDVFDADVVVTDLMMPELDGLGFIQEYMSQPTEHAPIVAVSGFEPFLEKALELGATATMQKPYAPRELAALTREVAAQHAPPEVTPPPARKPGAEDARLRAVFDLNLEQAPEPGLQRFLDEIAALFEVPISGISLVSKDSQRLVMQCSTTQPDSGGPRETSFCTHSVAARSALVVQDASTNAFFQDNPSVTERGFRFYAGVPLLATDDEAIGTLCILDYEAHAFTHVDLQLLELFGRRVVAVFERRDRRTNKDMPDSAYRCLSCVDEELDIYGKSLFSDLVQLEATRAIMRSSPAALVAVAVLPEQLKETANALRDAALGGLVGRLAVGRLAVVMRDTTAAEAQQLVASWLRHPLAIAATNLDHYQGTTGQALLEVEHCLGASGR